MAATVIGDLFVRLGVDATNLTRGLDSAEKRLESLGTRFFFLGSRVTAGVTLPIIGATGAIAKWGLEFDKAMTESLAIMRDVTPAIRSEMEQVAKDVAISTKFSAKEAAEGYFSLASAGLLSAEAMGALPIAARFAQAAVMGMAEASHYLAASQAAMASGSETAAEKVQQMAHVSDVLTEANNRALGTIRDFADALTNRAGVALRITNKSVEEGVAVLAAYAERGIMGKNAGTQLWMMMRDLQHAALENGDAFKKHGVSVFTASGAMKNMADIIGDMERATLNLTDAQKTQMMADLGMPQRSRAATIAILGQSEAIRGHEAALRAAGGATQEVADKQMKALTNRLVQLGEQFQSVGITLFQQFVPAIETMIEFGGRAASKLGELVREFGLLPEWVKVGSIAIVGLAAVVGPLVAMFGSMTLLFASSVQGFTALGKVIAQTALNIGLAVGASGKYSFVTAQMTAAQQAASIAAYTQARAMGQTWAQAVGAGRAAAAAAASTTIFGNAAAGAGASSTLFARAMANLPAVFTAGALALTTMAGWIGRATGSFLTMTAAVNILGPAIVQLFTGWRTESDKAEDSASGLGGVFSAAGSAFGVFKDATWMAGVGLKELIKIVQAQVMEDIPKMGQQVRDVADAWKGWGDYILSWIPGGRTAARVLSEDISSALDGLPDKIRRVGDAWGYLKIQTEFLSEGGADPAEYLKRQVEAMTKSLKGGMKDASISPKVAAPELWMLGSQSDFEKRLAKMKDAQTDFDAPPSKPKREQLTDEERDIRRYTEALAGQGTELDRLRKAWDRMLPSKQADFNIQDRLWQIYSKMRGELDALDPVFEKLFAKQIEQLSITGQLANGTNEWGIVMSDNASKIVDEIGQVTVAMMGMSKGEVDLFFKKHGNAIEELLPMYGEVNSAVRVLIDRYYAWAAAQSLTTSKTKEGAQKATEAINEFLNATGAKLADVQADIHQFSETAGETHRRTTKNKLNQIANDQEKHLRDMYSKMAFYYGKELDDYIEKINQQKALNAEYLRSVERYETLRYMASIGVNARIIRDHERLTQKELDEIKKRQEAWNQFIRQLGSGIAAIEGMGKLADVMGLDELTTGLAGAAAGFGTFVQGLDAFHAAENLGQQIAAVGTMALGARDAIKAMYDTAGRGNRALTGAASGAAMGGAVGGPWGALAGAVIGAVGGALMSPEWEKLGNDVKRRFGVSITKELMKQITADAKLLGGHFNAELMHLGEIIQQGGGLSAENVNIWAGRVAAVFSVLERKEISTANAAKVLDNVFNDLADAGMSTNGVLGRQVLELVKLEQHFRTGSTAIKDFVDAQLGIAAGGFNKIVGSTFGVMIGLLGEAQDADAALEKTNGLHQKAAKLRAQILDYEKEGTKNEKQKVALAIARLELLRTERQIQEQQAKQAAADKTLNALMGPGGQEVFDRMGRLAGAMFSAMTASGKGLFDIIKAMQPALDTLSIAQQNFGFKTTDTYNQLMKFSDFAKMNPELVEAISGLQQMMTGLHNSGYMTQEAFMDLGTEISFTFNELIAKGLTADEAMMAMHPTLQTLWELQRTFGYEVDETTQRLIDEAVASGKVGEQYMSANDKMVLGIDKLILRFDAFLRHLGINLPDEAEAGAQGLRDAFAGLEFNVPINLEYTERGKPGMPPTPPPPEYAEGGIVTRPHMGIVGEAGPEAIIPLDRLFAELDAGSRLDSSRDLDLTIVLDSRILAQKVFKHAPSVLRVRGV